MESSEFTVFEAVSEKEKILEKHIDDGIELAKKNQFEETMNHLRKPDVAKAVGMDLDMGPVFTINRNLSPDEEINMANNVALESIFDHSRDVPMIKIASVVALPEEITGKPTPTLSPQLLKETALIHLEEWIHALQFAAGKPLTGIKDEEKDMVNYLEKKGVALTPAFLQRH
jgi:hypothetical protein